MSACVKDVLMRGEKLGQQNGRERERENGGPLELAIQAWDTPQTNREMEGRAPNAELNELNGGNMAICHTIIIRVSKRANLE